MDSIVFAEPEVATFLMTWSKSEIGFVIGHGSLPFTAYHHMFYLKKMQCLLYWTHELCNIVQDTIQNSECFKTVTVYHISMTYYYIHVITWKCYIQSFNHSRL